LGEALRDVRTEIATVRAQLAQLETVCAELQAAKQAAATKQQIVDLPNSLPLCAAARCNKPWPMKPKP
jgi:hypothetical protein